MQKQKSGIIKPELAALPRIKDRITFLYVERCKINRQDGSIVFVDEKGSVHVPAATINTILLGPGTDITHRAVELIGNCGASIVWVGEEGVRYYAHGRSLAKSSRMLISQAKLVTNTRSRLAVARKMYQMRFDEDVSNLTMQQIRGREGSRVRKEYSKNSKKYNIKWEKREYDSKDFEGGTPVNQALSAAHACL